MVILKCCLLLSEKSCGSRLDLVRSLFALFTLRH
jgi:hypothetical protein